jgi:hypothetical protein
MRTSHSIRFIKASLAAASLTACVSIQNFADTTSPDAATVHFSMAAVPHSFWIYKNGLDCSGGFSIFPKDTIAAFVAGTGRPWRVEGNRELAIEVDGRALSPLRYCSVMASFFPEPGATYRVSFLKTDTSCGLAVTRMIEDKDGKREVREPSFKRRTPRPTVMSGNEPRCLAL